MKKKITSRSASGRKKSTKRQTHSTKKATPVAINKNLNAFQIILWLFIILSSLLIILNYL